MADDEFDAVGQARELVPLLREEADAAERARMLTPSVLDAVVESGLLPLVTPRRFGGRGAGLESLAQATRELAHGCPASAWTISFFMLHNWLVARFPDALGERVFRDWPFAFVPAPLAPTGEVTASRGGYRVSGRWEWATGVNHADWVLVHAVDPEAGATRFACLPVEEVVVEDVWYTSGMCATGSNAVRIEDAFVPAEHTLAGKALLDGASTDEPLDRLPVMAVLPTVAAAPALGAAERVVELFRERVSERVLAYTLGDRQVDEPAAQIRLATALAEVRAARAAWEEAMRRLVAAGARPAGATLGERAATRLAAAYAVRTARAAISTVCEASGASIYASSSPIQRLQRDVEVLKGHVVFDWDRTAQLVGRVELGLELRPTDLV